MNRPTDDPRRKYLINFIFTLPVVHSWEGGPFALPVNLAKTAAASRPRKHPRLKQPRDAVWVCAFCNFKAWLRSLAYHNGNTLCFVAGIDYEVGEPERPHSRYGRRRLGLARLQ